MNLTNTRRNELSTVPYLNLVLDGITQRANLVFRAEHTDDGAHTDISADSVTADAIAGETVTAVGAVTGTPVRSTAGVFERGRSVAMGESTSYTPTWTASGSAPTLGNGTLIGRSCRVGLLVFVQIQFTFGSTSAAGTGVWSFSLPTAAASTTFPGALSAVLLDSGTAHYVAAGRLATTTTVSVVADTSNGIGDGSPFVWATGDTVTIEGWYLGT